MQDNQPTAHVQSVENSGIFMSNLRRSNQQIIQDRAASIAESTEITYRRSIEDSRLRLRELRRQRDAALDLAPNDANSLRHASNFNPKSFVDNDVKLSLEIKDLEEKVQVAVERYGLLFGQNI